MPYPKQNVTDLLNAWGAGDKGAFDELVTVVYAELRRQASRYLRRENPGHTLQTTDLIHEAYLRLVDQKTSHWQNRAQFFGIAAQLMRRILVDHARARHRAKRGGQNIRISLDEEVADGRVKDVELIDIDEALNRLAEIDIQQSKIVELRFFSGLNVEETAQILGISPRTVKRSWRFAKAWLRRELHDHDRNHLSE
ncbi:MAG TPA: sigma-70 family RNA polymerase sigma factor [Pyrinomonadaceae bacterium]|jgi:RNA polymerase sigma factor (TIGR02999 family)|nr:sigma-70 family RNA polymerase sigma factor [Pyrinomonadaceae bacterium]